MAALNFTCNICTKSELKEITEYARLPRVSSDCKPVRAGGRLAVCGACGAVQKPMDAHQQAEVDAIYRNYEPYYQSGGIEQAVFDPAKGVPRRRSDVVLERLAQVHALPPAGRILDVGCGNGVLLRAFSETHSGWRLFGHELSDLHADSLKQIAGFEKLICGPLSDLPSGFDLITMMHALEHLPDPFEGISQLRPKLNDRGCLFIEVPNAEATPFDLVIADHVSHFSRHDLARLFTRAGMVPAQIANDWVTKELSAVAVERGAPVSLPPAQSPAEVLVRVRAQIAWLHAVIEGARQAACGTQFGLFGTSVASMWLFGELSDEVAFFVDEDPSRRNTTLFGRPVYTPAEAPAGASVFMLLIPAVAHAVRARLQGHGVRWHLPPDIGGN